MTITEIAELISRRTGAEFQLTWGFAQSFIETIVECLDRGHEVKIRGLGTFHWVDIKQQTLPFGRKVPAGRKLKFKAAKQFYSRRLQMSDDGMTKLGVVLDDDKTKTAGKGSDRICPICGSKLDDAGACPVHGTQPFEPTKK